MILAGDVGATKILLEAGDFRSERWQPVLARRYLIDDFANFPAAITRFLEEFDEVRPPRAKITAAGIGVAGPVEGNKVKMTHRPWTIDGASLSRRFDIGEVRVVNDLAAAAYGIDALSAGDLVTLQPGKSVAGEPKVVLGVGTGLGVAYLVSRDGEYQVLPGEGGHVGFSPSSPPTLELMRAFFLQHGRAEAEDFCSGRGLSNIYEIVARGPDEPVAGAKADPSWVTEGARERDDDSCISTLNLFAECLGTVAGDHALAVMARGGVYLAGGVMAKLIPDFNVERFRRAFCAKGAFSSHLMKIPVKAVRTERLPILGAARWANN